MVPCLPSSVLRISFSPTRNPLMAFSKPIYSAWHMGSLFSNLLYEQLAITNIPSLSGCRISATSASCLARWSREWLLSLGYLHPPQLSNSLVFGQSRDYWHGQTTMGQLQYRPSRRERSPQSIATRVVVIIVVSFTVVSIVVSMECWLDLGIVHALI